MKTKTILILVTLLISSTLVAQNPATSTRHSDSEIATLIQNFNNSRTRDVRADAALAQRFRQDFPRARDIDWETNGEIYEAEFNIGRRDFVAFYDREGNLLMFRQDIRTSALPAAARTAARASLPNYRIEDVDKIVKGRRTFFRIEMERRDHDVVIYVDSNGQVLANRPVY